LEQKLSKLVVVFKPRKVWWSSTVVANRTFEGGIAGPLSESPHKVAAQIFSHFFFPSVQASAPTTVKMVSLLADG
jgi:hypothetical protein